MKEKFPSVLESILFMSGDFIKIKDLAEYFEISSEEMLKYVEELRSLKYSNSDGIIIKIANDGVCLTTNPENFDSISKFFKFDENKILSNAALEVLSIIAYRQPVTKVRIDNIRGVKSDNILKKLLNSGLIEIVGREEKPGNPNLYGTTDKFLLKFNLDDLENLPQIEKNLTGEEF